MRFLLFVLLMAIPTTVSAAMQPKQIILENGLTILLIERHSLPVVSLAALVKAGSINDPAGLSGVANLTASLLDEGTLTRTSAQISEEIDFIGASLSISANKDFTTAHLRVLTKDMETGFDLLSDVLRRPRFDSKEVERVRKLILGSIHAEQDDPMVVAARAFDGLVFGDHPYRYPVVGQAPTVEKITREEVAQFHQTHYFAGNTILAIVGDVTPENAVRLAKKYFAEWNVASPKNRSSISPPGLRPAKQELIEKGLTQSSIRMGHVGISRKNPDFYPVIVMNYILGSGGFSSRLLKEIRDNQGLVYSVHSFFDANAQPGSFAISMQTQTANTKKAIAGVMEEVKRIIKASVSETELSEAKAYLMGSFPLRLETTHALAEILSQVGFYELGLTYFEDYPKQLGKVTREDVLRVAQTYLHPDQFQLVVVGNLAEAKLGLP